MATEVTDGMNAGQVAAIINEQGIAIDGIQTGTDGMSAYEVAVSEGFDGTVDEWLLSLQGENGSQGLSAYQIAVAGGYSGTVNQWISSLKGDKGDSAYQIAVANGYSGTQTQWLLSLKGEQGIQGLAGVSLVKTYLLQNNSAVNTINATPVISMPIKANSKYKIDFHLKVSCDGAGGSRFNFTSPLGSNYSVHSFGNTSSAGAFNSATQTTDAMNSTPLGTIARVESTAGFVKFQGTIEAVQEGLLILNMFSVTAGQISTVWKVGSYFTIEEVI